jgi:predicted ribosomally synthesized peptide with SipW-like signal peptide
MSDESEDTTLQLQLTRRRALGALVTIGAGSAAAGAGTFALFSDTESSSGNVVTAETLDLTTDSSGSTLTVIDTSETTVKPGSSGSGSVEVTNSGSIDGSLDVNTGDIASREHGVSDPETGAEGEDGPGGTGELIDNLHVAVWLSNSDSGDSPLALAGSENPGTLNENNSTVLSNAFAANEDYDTDFSMPADSTTTIHVAWWIPEGVGNEIQGDSVSVDFDFELNQQDSQ